MLAVYHSSFQCVVCVPPPTVVAGASYDLGMYRKALVLLPFVALTLGGASDAPLDRATLRGLMGVNVVIDPVAPEIEKEGATTDALRNRFEERIRRAGISIDTDSREFVGLRVTAVRAARRPLGNGAMFAIAATIGLYQRVTLVRDPSVRTSTQTWEVDTVMLVDTKEVHRACMDSMDELAGRFVAAYRSVNPAGDHGPGGGDARLSATPQRALEFNATPRLRSDCNDSARTPGAAAESLQTYYRYQVVRLLALRGASR